MNQRQFRDLLRRYIQGKCTPEENRLIEQWYEKMEQPDAGSLSPEEKQLREERMLQNILRQTRNSQVMLTASKKSWTVSPRSWGFYGGIAASLLLLISLAWYGWNAEGPGVAQKLPEVFATGTELTQQTNTSAETQTIRLEDHSRVILTPGSSISYPRHFADGKREVHLQGNAFFEVSRNPQKPFLVYCGAVVTQVLGTSFWVKSPKPDQAVEVEVKSGRVSVFERKAAFEPNPTGTSPTGQGVILTPNQKVTYFSKEHQLVTGIVENPQPVHQVPKPGSLVFTETPLPVVLQELQREYAIEIVLEHEKLKTCTVTGDLGGMSLYEQLDVICQALKASYEVKGTQLLISGKGCE
jgi:ferric-dicitrate binding protein FerR (iron transport regulator)